MGRIFLIRHGEVEWNRDNAYAGSTDIPLNAKGIEQAKRLAASFDNEDISAIYSSDLMRAFVTAETIAERLNLAVHPVRALQEVDYGEWEGVYEADIAKNYADVFSRWQHNPVDVRIPGGETFGELRDRAFPAFCEIAQAHKDENVIVVAHKSTNRVILCCILGMDVNHYKQISQGNACINIVEVRKNGDLVVDTINERCHLGEE